MVLLYYIIIFLLIIPSTNNKNIRSRSGGLNNIYDIIGSVIVRTLWSIGRWCGDGTGRGNGGARVLDLYTCERKINN